MSFRTRTFPEVLENLLTSLTGGVASESQPFPPPGQKAPPYTFALQQPPATDIVSVWGARDGEAHEFRKNQDYTLSDDGRSLVIPEKGAELPDPGTLIYVNYVPTGAQPELTDVQIGSVARTLLETTALELGRVYALLDTVYKSAYVDTATDDSLDNVVALLGIERVRGGRPVGDVEFTRADETTGELTIPAGTRIATADAKTQYELTATVSLSDGQKTVRGSARDLEPNDPLPAGRLTLLPVPIAGIASVTNPGPTAIATQDETDDELRTRAKNFLHGSERATRGALDQALRGVGVTADIDETTTPGRIAITPHVDALPPDLLQRLTESIERVRPAGVLVQVGTPQPPHRVDLQLRLTTASGLLTQDLRAAQRSVKQKIGDYFDRLPAKDPASINQLVGLALGVDGVQDVTLVSATVQNGDGPQNVLDLPTGQLDIAGFPTVLGELHIADPNLPTTLDVTVSYPQSADPPDVAAITAALTDAISSVNAANESASGFTLVYGQLLDALPLPNHAAHAVPIPAGGGLPTEDDVTPYAVTFVFTLESGLSQVLDDHSDSYALTPYERLSLGGVEGAPVA
jgi:Baseplate J-like protein